MVSQDVFEWMKHKAGEVYLDWCNASIGKGRFHSPADAMLEFGRECYLRGIEDATAKIELEPIVGNGDQSPPIKPW